MSKKIYDSDAARQRAYRDRRRKKQRPTPDPAVQLHALRNGWHLLRRQISDRRDAMGAGDWYKPTPKPKVKVADLIELLDYIDAEIYRLGDGYWYGDKGDFAAYTPEYIS